MASKDSQSQNQPHGRSYLAQLSPWTRSPALQPSKGKDGEPDHAPLVKQQQGADYVVSQKHRLSLRKYPRDCPPLRPQWFHAVDSPKRRPNPAGDKIEKALPAPKKYAAFSVRDSKRIEGAYGKLAEEEERKQRWTEDEQEGGDVGMQKKGQDGSRHGATTEGNARVPVNEDYLFDVDIARRELGPAYWLGPVYAVRRGTWFYQEGAVQRPCDESLAAQLEDGYLKVRPWRFPQPKAAEKEKARSASQPRQRPTSWTPGQPVEKAMASVPITPKGSNPDLRRQALEETKAQEQQLPLESGQTEQPLNTYRLFGSHMNSVVTYQDAHIAWLLTDDFMARMNYTMYQRFAGGGHFGGIKITRGYQPQVKKPVEVKDNKSGGDEGEQSAAKDDAEDEEEGGAEAEQQEERQSISEVRRAKLERHMSSLLEDAGTPEDRAKQEEEVRKRDEREMEEDYRETENDDPDRDIEHLILVTHGIGQRLGLRIDSVNFVHDVNTLRKTLKAVYADSPDLRALNAELDESLKVNSRIQVLPICWRHLLDFPKQSLKHNRREHDLGDTEFDDDDLEYPSLEDISVEGVPAVRNLITDLALDILLYQSPAYKHHISRIVLEECNRIYHLFMQRNPTFAGKVSFIGHSLGSAIMFDLLCRQGTAGQKGGGAQHTRRERHPLRLDFEVEDFYALGSPIGLFQMLKGRTVQAREMSDSSSGKRAVSTSIDNHPSLHPATPPSLGRASKASSAATANLPNTGDIQVSSPQCAQIFNIFHPTDPISYRMEPLISPTMAALKPQPLPYTKRGIFGAQMGQGLTGIGARVSQSVSSMWSSMASSLLTRGLGYTGAEPTGLPQGQQKSGNPLALGLKEAAGSAQTPGVDEAAVVRAKATAQENHDKLAEHAAAGNKMPGPGQHPPALIDAEIETLFSGYQKRRKSQDGGEIGAKTADEWRETEERGKRLRREEEKVRRLNSNGRVDYAIQEGALSINLLTAIASHLSYWGDEDVSHFVISQLLSRQRAVRSDGGLDGAEDAGQR